MKAAKNAPKKALRKTPDATFETAAGPKSHRLRLEDFTRDQDRIMFDDVERRHRNFVELWRGCADRRCRRQRECLGCPKFPCTGGRMMEDRTKRQNLRLARDLLHAPPPPGFLEAADRT
jgi:hypothetical protein